VDTLEGRVVAERGLLVLEFRIDSVNLQLLDLCYSTKNRLWAINRNKQIRYPRTKLSTVKAHSFDIVLFGQDDDLGQTLQWAIDWTTSIAKRR
jgi:hypothetical protein